MRIPGLRVLDEIIAGLPTNSAQRIELAKLRGEIELKDRKIVELESQIAKLTPPLGVEADAVKILKAFFDSDTDLHPDDIAHRFGMKPSVVKYHLDKLANLNFVRWTNVDGSYGIYPEGREFIVKNGLA